MSAPSPATIPRAALAEAVGTFVLVLFGTGAVHAAVLTGAQSGLWQVAIVWGIGVAVAIALAGAASGAHLNPAITAAMALYRGFPASRVPAYVAAQVAGAFAAAALLHVVFGGPLEAFELARGIVRGGPGSEASAMAYGEYFPNPALFPPGSPAAHSVSLAAAFLAEALGTALLALAVFALTDERNPLRPGPGTVGIAVGLALAAIISVIAPLTQAGLNPARDFGPRLFAFLAGWGPVAIPGPRGGFFVVYVVAPVAGAVGGAGLWQRILRPRPLPES